jgi:hypothetical protein
MVPPAAQGADGGIIGTMAQCSATAIPIDGIPRQCRRNATGEVDGKPYCTQHSPVRRRGISKETETDRAIQRAKRALGERRATVTVLAVDLAHWFTAYGAQGMDLQPLIDAVGAYDAAEAYLYWLERLPEGHQPT